MIIDLNGVLPVLMGKEKITKNTPSDSGKKEFRAGRKGGPDLSVGQDIEKRFEYKEEINGHVLTFYDGVAPVGKDPEMTEKVKGGVDELEIH